MKNTTITEIERIICTTSQATICRLIYKIKDKLIKVKIKRDSFDEQSYAKAWVWSGDKWQDVYSIPYPLMRTKNLIHTPLYIQNNGKNMAFMKQAWADFEIDREQLKKNAEAILF